jgi:hypothetical protein
MHILEWKAENLKVAILRVWRGGGRRDLFVSFIGCTLIPPNRWNAVYPMWRLFLNGQVCHIPKLQDSLCI